MEKIKIKRIENRKYISGANEMRVLDPGYIVDFAQNKENAKLFVESEIIDMPGETEGEKEDQELSGIWERIFDMWMSIWKHISRFIEWLEKNK